MTSSTVVKVTRTREKPAKVSPAVAAIVAALNKRGWKPIGGPEASTYRYAGSVERTVVAIAYREVDPLGDGKLYVVKFTPRGSRRMERLDFSIPTLSGDVLKQTCSPNFAGVVEEKPAKTEKSESSGRKARKG